MYYKETSLDDVIKNHYCSNDNQNPGSALLASIKKKFSYHVEKSETFIVEEYIETEWRDSFELYYSRSSYNCVSTVKRIHFIAAHIENYEDVNDNNYLGYLNIRPLPLYEFAISRIRLKYIKESFCLKNNNTKFYCLAIETNVNFPHISIKYKSFPLYFQDSMVAVCAHADLLMISKFMLKKYNFNNYRLRDIIINNKILYDQGRQIPSEGLTIHQMIEVLKANNYNPISVHFENGKNGKINIIEYIDSFLESSLPVILAYQQHVVVIIGHTHGDKKHYIIADDSSYHLKNSFKKDKHMAVVLESELLNILKKEEISYLIAPTFDRFYLKYSTLKLIVRQSIEKLKSKLPIKNYKIKSREILVESAKVKQFLYSCGDKSYSEVFLPHFIWYVEFYLERELLAYMLVDAVAHKSDTIYSLVRNKNGQSVNIVGETMTIPQPLSLLVDIE